MTLIVDRSDASRPCEHCVRKHILVIWKNLSLVLGTHTHTFSRTWYGWNDCFHSKTWMVCIFVHYISYFFYHIILNFIYALNYVTAVWRCACVFFFSYDFSFSLWKVYVHICFVHTHTLYAFVMALWSQTNIIGFYRSQSLASASLNIFRLERNMK